MGVFGAEVEGAVDDGRSGPEDEAVDDETGDPGEEELAGKRLVREGEEVVDEERVAGVTEDFGGKEGTVAGL